MKSLKSLLLIVAVACSPLLGVASAEAAPVSPALVPPLDSDAWYGIGAGGVVIQGGFSEKDEPAGLGAFNNTGIPTTNGWYMTLTEKNGKVSDYIWAQGGIIYFSSDDEKANVPPPPIADLRLAFVGSLPETGDWQRIDGILNQAGYPTAPAWVASDVTPLPSTWTMMLLGLGVLGFLAFRRLDSGPAGLATA